MILLSIFILSFVTGCLLGWSIRGIIEIRRLKTTLAKEILKFIDDMSHWVH